MDPLIAALYATNKAHEAFMIALSASGLSKYDKRVKENKGPLGDAYRAFMEADAIFNKLLGR